MELSSYFKVVKKPKNVKYLDQMKDKARRPDDLDWLFFLSALLAGSYFWRNCFKNWSVNVDGPMEASKFAPAPESAFTREYHHERFIGRTTSKTPEKARSNQSANCTDREEPCRHRVTIGSAEAPTKQGSIGTRAVRPIADYRNFSRSQAGRSVVMPSTPTSTSRLASMASFTVQT